MILTLLSASIITLVLLGNLLEQRSVKQTTTAISDLSAIQVTKANLVGLSLGKEVITEIDYKDIIVGSILQVNQILKTKYAEDERVHFLQIGHLFTTSNGEISQLIMPDYLHLSEAGYQIWADAILPHLVEQNSNK